MRRGYPGYVYAPKAARYLRREWRKPFPIEELAQLMALSMRFRERRKIRNRADGLGDISELR
jgi:beta-N-acetylglucosaminidase